MIGLMIIHAAMGSAVQPRLNQSGTTTRGVEAHLLKALIGWACLTKTQLSIEDDIPYLPGLERRTVRRLHPSGAGIGECRGCSQRSTGRRRSPTPSETYARLSARRALQPRPGITRSSCRRRAAGFSRLQNPKRRRVNCQGQQDQCRSA